jgi:hypothetical protein
LEERWDIVSRIEQRACRVRVAMGERSMAHLWKTIFKLVYKKVENTKYSLFMSGPATKLK